MSACKCNVSLSNTGKASCEPIASVIKKLILVPLYDSTGVRNSITLTDTFNAAYFTAKVNHADATKRWYPTPEIKNVESAKADSVFETFNDQSKDFIQEGVRSFTGIMPSTSPAYLGKLKAARCTEVGVYAIDKDGSLIGSLTDAGLLYPIKVDAGSFNPTLVFGTDSTIQKINLTFDFDVNERDEDIAMIISDDMVAGVNLLTLNGLLDVYSLVSGVAATTFTAKLYTSFGSAVSPITVKGLLLADFALYNVTDSAALAISAVVETSGTYVFTHASAVAGKVRRLTPTKNGYDFAPVVANTFTF